ERVVVADVLPGHQEADDAEVDEKAVHQRIETETTLDAAACHVGHLVLTVSEAVDDGDLDPSGLAVELAFETESPVLLVPIFGRVHVDRFAVQYEAPVLCLSRRGQARRSRNSGEEREDQCAHGLRKASPVP